MAKRFYSYLWIPLLFLWEVVVQPIWNLNIEAMATSQGLADELGQAAEKVDHIVIPVWVWEWLSFFTGDFLWGAVTVGSIYFAVDLAAWIRRRKAISPDEKNNISHLSSIYVDAFQLNKLMATELKDGHYGREHPGNKTVSIGVRSKTRSFFAKLCEFDVQTPTIRDGMSVEDARLVIEFLAMALPFIGSSQVKHLRDEAKAYVANAAKS